MSDRVRAARILFDVIENKRSLQTCFRQQPTDATVKALCFGTCRYYFSLSEALSTSLDKPIKKSKKIIHYLLLIALYELYAEQKQAYAIVSESVNACDELKCAWAKGLVNAVLRRYQRGVTTTVQWEHPAWFVNALQADWPDDWQAILKANMKNPPLWVRLNLNKISIDKFKQTIPCEHEPAIPTAARLRDPIDVEKIPGFNRGCVSVQDASSQCLSLLVDVKPGLKVLDACAAPGGKLCLLKELEPELDVTALEISPKRAERVRDNLQRCDIQAVNLKVADATAIETWYEGEPFDWIIIDAPCSATGIIRRQVDIKCHRQADDIEDLKKTQQNLLATLWPLLKPGGFLIYMTCSVLKDENERQIQAFSESFNAKIIDIELPVGRAQAPGWQIHPGEADMDGFYFAKLQKLADRH